MTCSNSVQTGAYPLTILHVSLQFGTALSDAQAEGHTDVVRLLQQYSHTDIININIAHTDWHTHTQPH